MVSFADVQRLVEQNGATVSIVICPSGFPHQVYSKAGDTICVSAGTPSNFYGPVACGTDLETCLVEALKKAPKATVDLGDMLA